MPPVADSATIAFRRRRNGCTAGRRRERRRPLRAPEIRHSGGGPVGRGAGRVIGTRGAEREAAQPQFMTVAEVASLLREHEKTIMRLALRDDSMPCGASAASCAVRARGADALARASWITEESQIRSGWSRKW